MTWAIDLHSSESALLLTLLLDHDRKVVYMPGITVNRAAEGYKGAGKTGAKDALIIADQARMRGDLTVLDGDARSQSRTAVLGSSTTDRGGPANRAEIAAETAADRWNLTG